MALNFTITVLESKKYIERNKYIVYRGSTVIFIIFHINSIFVGIRIF